MADGYHYLDQPLEESVLSSIYPKRSNLAESALEGLALSTSASSPYFAIAQAQAAPSQDMYSGQGGRGAPLNGGQSGRLPNQIPYSFQPLHTSHGHGGPSGHLTSVQPDHAQHNGGTPALTHPSGYASGPYSGMQNGTHGSHVSTPSGGQPRNITEHWQKQLQMFKEAERANIAMTEGNQPHYYARLKAPENKSSGPPREQADEEGEDLRRPQAKEKAARQEWHNLDFSGQGLRNLSPKLFNYKFLNELYIASNKLTCLPPAIGELRQLTVLDASFNEIQELPAELGMCTYLKTLLLFSNRLRTLPFELGSLHMLENLGIEGNRDFSSELRHQLAEKGTKHLITYLRENATPPPPPPIRELVTIQEDVSSTLERFKVFSWNVLCDKYATPQTYGYTPAEALSWEYRKECIFKEIRDRDADFLALQEISTGAFRDDFQPELANWDYKGVQWPKTRAKTMPEKDALGVDGCAIFWKNSKYILLDKQVIEFASIAINRPDMKNQHDVFNRVMPKDNIAVIGFFESRMTGARIIMVNVHLTWDSLLADVKAIQTGILMEYVTKLAEKYARWPPLKDKKLITFPVTPTEGSPEEAAPPPAEPAPSQEYRINTDIPLLVCGDFNSTEDSSVYELMSLGRVPPDHLELNKYQYGSFTRDGIEHPFSLRDAYAHVKGGPYALPFTNYTPGFADVIDYLWYSTNTLEVVELLGPPDADYLKRMPAFPNYHFPADHIQIMAEFVVKARKDKKVHPEPDFGSGSGGR